MREMGSKFWSTLKITHWLLAKSHGALSLSFRFAVPSWPKSWAVLQLNWRNAQVTGQALHHTAECLGWICFVSEFAFYIYNFISHFVKCAFDFFLYRSCSWLTLGLHPNFSSFWPYSSQEQHFLGHNIMETVQSRNPHSHPCLHHHSLNDMISVLEIQTYAKYCRNIKFFGLVRISIWSATRNIFRFVLLF